MPTTRVLLEIIGFFLVRKPLLVVARFDRRVPKTIGEILLDCWAVLDPKPAKNVFELLAQFNGFVGPFMPE